jgi:uncharacterized protein YcgI (DUF1989 family)
MAAPRVIYDAKPGSPLAVDHAFYARLARQPPSPTLVHRFICAHALGPGLRCGRQLSASWREGPQVADFNAWNLDNRAAHAWASAPSSPPRARHHLRPALVLPALPPAHAHHHQRHHPLRPRRGWRGLSRLARHAL